MSREKTVEEVREEFLEYVATMINYWDKKVDNQTTKERLEGLAHSILVALDGCAGELPGFVVAPCPHSEDKQYHIDEGSDYYPEIDDERLAEILKRVKNATETEWEVWNDYHVCDIEGNLLFSGSSQSSNNRNDAEFVAHARQDIPYLISSLQSERAKIASLETESAMNRNLAIQIEKDSNYKIDCLGKKLKAEKVKVDELQKELDKYTILRPIEDIHEDYGDVLCWNFPIEYSPEIKSCLDLSFKEKDYTHFTLMPNIKNPIDGK